MRSDSVFIDCSSLSCTGCIDVERLSAAIPSAAARRAASAVPPKIRGDLGVRKAAQVVVGHRLSLLVGQRLESGHEVVVRSTGSDRSAWSAIESVGTARRERARRRRSPADGRSSPATLRRSRRPAASGRPSSPKGTSRTMHRQRRWARPLQHRRAARSVRGPRRWPRTAACSACHVDATSRASVMCCRRRRAQLCEMAGTHRDRGYLRAGPGAAADAIGTARSLRRGRRSAPGNRGAGGCPHRASGYRRHRGSPAPVGGAARIRLPGRIGGLAPRD